MRIYAIFLSLNTLFWFGAKAQQLSRHNTFSYNVNEGLLQTAMLDMAVDKNNYCWISFPNGIQKFDGKNFISVPAQPGLPDDKGVYFFRIGSGELLVSHAGGISHYNSNNNRFTLLVNENVSSKRSQFLGEENGVIYYYNKNGNIVGLDNHTYKTVYHMPAGWQPPNNYYRMGENIINQKAAVLVDSAVYLLDLKTKRILYKPVIIRGISFYFLVLKNEEEILFFQRKGKSYALQLYNFKSEKTKTLRIAEENSIGFRGNIYQWQGKQLLAVFNRLYQVDNDYKEITAEIVNFQNEPVGPSAITRIREDNYGNLLVGTINAGIRKIIRNNYPVKYYGVPQEKNNYIISLLPDKQTGRVFAGTLSNGLFVFDTLQQPVKHIRILPNKKQNFSVQAIVKSPHGDYFLFVGTERVIWKLSSDLRTLTPVKIKTTLAGKENSVSYFTKVIACNKKEALVQSQPFLYRLDFETNTVTQAEISASHPMSALLYEQSILVHTNDSLYYLDSRTLQTTRVIFFPATGSVRCYESEGDRIYIGSNKGIFMIEGDGRVQNHLTKETGLPDECIYAMSLDKEGRLWCSTNRGIFGLGKDNSILQLTKTDGLQENEFNNNAVAQAGDGELFFGGVNGISSFYPSAINPYIDNPALLITEVKINNETYKSNNAVWAVETITVPHNQNSFSFDFIAMGASNPDQYIYQYKMGGIDKEWIQNDGAQTVRYYLPPGHYVFAVSASRIFDKNAKALKEIVIVVQQPFWKRPWFIAGGAVLLLVLLAFIIYRYIRSKYRKKFLALEAEHKLQLERERISRDLHDNIGAYASAIVANVDKVAKHTADEMVLKSLKENAGEIIHNLRDTIWALNKKQISAIVLSDRIKAHLQKMREAYPAVKIVLDETIAATTILSPEIALNALRIAQEALHNAIKHSGGNEIVITLKIGKELCIAVKDNGTGLSSAINNGGNGFENMKARAEEANLQLQIISTDGKGTSVEVFSPLQ